MRIIVLFLISGCYKQWSVFYAISFVCVPSFGPICLLVFAQLPNEYGILSLFRGKMSLFILFIFYFIYLFIYLFIFFSFHRSDWPSWARLRVDEGNRMKKITKTSQIASFSFFAYVHCTRAVLCIRPLHQGGSLQTSNFCRRPISLCIRPFSTRPKLVLGVRHPAKNCYIDGNYFKQ